jgi:hypothetical protein
MTANQVTLVVTNPTHVCDCERGIIWKYGYIKLPCPNCDEGQRMFEARADFERQMWLEAEQDRADHYSLYAYQ